MPNLRVILWVLFGMLLWLNIQTWTTDYRPDPAPAAATGTTPDAPGAELPAGLPDLPEAPAAAAAAPALPGAAENPPAAIESSARLVRVRTDVLDIAIDPRGGDLVEAILPRYPVAKDRPDEPVQLLNPDPARLYVFRSGLRAAGGRAEPTHLVNWRAERREYVLDDGADELVVPLRWESGDGVTVTKRYRFRRGRYDVALDYQVANNSDTPYQAAGYVQIQRAHTPPERSMFNVDSYSFEGPVVYDGNKYDKLDVDDLDDEPYQASHENGWIASIQHHFLAAAVPAGDGAHSYSVTLDRGRYLLSAIGPLAKVEPGGGETIPFRLFVGPKLQQQLGQVAEDLPLTVDYGVLTILAQPLFWLLEKVHGFVNNWGVAIILVTVLIKLLFYKLTETSGRSMAKMRKLQPRLKSLQERYKDDRQALSQAMMELYKKEKVNPAAGCLPMLVQIPFFIAFYWVLLESVEMRQAPFALWITDLSTRDPFFILPLLMGVAMWFQQKLNPAPPDPVQAKVMQILPVVFTVFFAFFPAGLVLYWLTNSLLSIAQQWNINRKIEA